MRAPRFFPLRGFRACTDAPHHQSPVEPAATTASSPLRSRTRTRRRSAAARHRVVPRDDVPGAQRSVVVPRDEFPGAGRDEHRGDVRVPTHVVRAHAHQVVRVALLERAVRRRRKNQVLLVVEFYVPSLPEPTHRHVRDARVVRLRIERVPDHLKARVARDAQPAHAPQRRAAHRLRLRNGGDAAGGCAASSPSSSSRPTKPGGVPGAQRAGRRPPGPGCRTDAAAVSTGSTRAPAASRTETRPSTKRAPSASRKEARRAGRRVRQPRDAVEGERQHETLGRVVRDVRHARRDMERVTRYRVERQTERLQLARLEKHRVRVVFGGEVAETFRLRERGERRLGRRTQVHEGGKPAGGFFSRAFRRTERRVRREGVHAHSRRAVVPIIASSLPSLPSPSPAPLGLPRTRNTLPALVATDRLPWSPTPWSARNSAR